MEELPTPLSRVELYLAKAAGLNVTPPEPKSRLELFLAKIAGMDVEMPAPLSLKEMWLAHVAGSAPIEPLAIEGAFYIDNQKVDVRYLAVAAGVIGATLPEKPQNRKEQYWLAIASGAPIVGVLKYVTGTNITLTDVVSGIEELQFVYGDTYQQTYSGANLFNYTDTSATPGSGITTDSDGWITCTYDNSAGTSTRYSNYYTTPLALTPSTNYALVLEIRSVSGTGQFEGGGANAAAQVETFRIDFVNMTAGSTIVVPITSKSDVSGVNGLRSYFRFNAGQSGSVTLRISVLADTSVTPQTFVYQPYTGGIPAPNPDYPQPIQVATGEQTVTLGDGDTTQTYPISLTGKNLWGGFKTDVNFALAHISWVNKADGTITANGTATALSPSMYSSTAVSNNHTITLKAGTYTLSGGVSDDIRVELVKSDGTSLGISGATSKTITVSEETVVFVRGSIINGTTVSNIELKPQLEQGSTATPYIPYSPIELCKLGDYQDYIYKSGDDWYVHKEIGKVVLNGSESWTVQPRITSAWNTSKPSTLATGETRLLSNYFSEFKTSVVALVGSGIVVGGALNIRNITVTDGDTAEFKTWLSNHNTVIYYPSTTSTDTKITDATLVGQLNAIDSAVLPKPIAYITVGATDPNLPAPIKISYYGQSA